jgi:hypothetical protein
MHIYFHNNFQNSQYEDYKETNGYFIQMITFFIDEMRSREYDKFVPEKGSLIYNLILQIKKSLTRTDSKSLKSAILRYNEILRQPAYFHNRRSLPNANLRIFEKYESKKHKYYFTRSQ